MTFPLKSKSFWKERNVELASAGSTQDEASWSSLGGGGGWQGPTLTEEHLTALWGCGCWLVGGLYPTPVNRWAALMDSGFREITRWESDLERRPGGGGVRSRGWVWPKRIVYNIKKPQVTCRKYVSKRKGDVLLFYAFVHFYFDIYISFKFINK